MSYSNGLGNLQGISSAPTSSVPATSASADARRVDLGADTAIVPATATSTSGSAPSSLVGQALIGPDVRTDKVAALQQAIAAGTYNVSASDVAGKIIDSLLT